MRERKQSGSQCSPLKRETTPVVSFLSENSPDGPLLQWHTSAQLARSLHRLLQRHCGHDLRQTHMTGHKNLRGHHMRCSQSAIGFLPPRDRDSSKARKLLPMVSHAALTVPADKQYKLVSTLRWVGFVFFNQDCCRVCYSRLLKKTTKILNKERLHFAFCKNAEELENKISVCFPASH